MLKTVGSAAVAGGVAGAKHSVATGLRGTFTWAEWGREAEMGKTIKITSKRSNEISWS